MLRVIAGIRAMHWHIRANLLCGDHCYALGMHYTAPAELVETFSVFVNPEIEDEKIDLIRAALVIARDGVSRARNRRICRAA